MDVKEAKIKLQKMNAGILYFAKDEEYEEYAEAINVVLSELEKKDKDIQRMQELLDLSDAKNVKKDKIIDEMAEHINILSNEKISETGINDLPFCSLEDCTNNPERYCEHCVKEYFTKKCENKKYGKQT